MQLERHPVETAAREAAAALRASFQPLETAVATLGRIALLHFASPEAEADFARQLRELASKLRLRNQAEGATIRSLRAGVIEMEKNATLLASSKK